MRKAKYIRNSSSFSFRDVKFLDEMIGKSKEIGYDEFIKNVNIRSLKEVFPNYHWGKGDPEERKSKLRLRDDWSVSFHVSKYMGRKCWYVNHSAIEYIFIKESVE